MSRIVHRFGLLFVCAVAVAAAVGVVTPGAGQSAGRRPATLTPSAPLTPTQKARLDRKAASFAERAFDDPDLAVEFYVNSRTGPINTRGANITTGARPLTPAAYLPALQQMRAMPRVLLGDGRRAPELRRLPDLNAAPGAALGTWSNLGPANQGGRTRALLINPNNPNIMYAGGVAGGVWKSTDAGANWAPIDRPADEQHRRGDPGLRSAERQHDLRRHRRGLLQRRRHPRRGHLQVDRRRGHVEPARVHQQRQLLLHDEPGREPARQPAHLRGHARRASSAPSTAARLDEPDQRDAGERLHRARDAGATAPPGSCSPPAAPSPRAPIYRAVDDDVSTFTSVFSLAGMGRSSLAVAPSDRKRHLRDGGAGHAAAAPGSHGLHGVYRSIANGDPGSFTTQMWNGTRSAPATAEPGPSLQPGFRVCVACGPGSAGFFNQGWYDNVIAVDPLDPNRVWAGGIDLFRSDDGGVNWGAAGYWWFTKGVDPEYHHADQHGIVVPSAVQRHEQQSDVLG